LNNGMLRMLTETTHRDIVWRKSKCTNHQTILVYIDAIVIEETLLARKRKPVHSYLFTLTAEQNKHAITLNSYCLTLDLFTKGDMTYNPVGFLVSTSVIL